MRSDVPVRGAQRDEVIAMGSGVSIDQLERVLKNDRKAMKNIFKAYHYAVALERWRGDKKNASLSQIKDVALGELREALGEEHFLKVHDRIIKLLEKGEAENVAV